MATQRYGADAGFARSGHVEAAITARPIFSDEQRAMVCLICCSGDCIEVVPDVVGSGKIYAFAAAHESWQAASLTVTGDRSLRPSGPPAPKRLGYLVDDHRSTQQDA